MTQRIIWHHTPGMYTTSKVSQFWDYAHADVTVDATNGYGSTPALSGSSLSAYVRRQLPTGGRTTFGIGTRLKISSLPATEKIILGVTDADGALVSSLSVLSDGRLAVYRGELESLLGIYTGPITTGSQLRLGLTVSIGSGSTGHATLYLGTSGIPIINATGVNTGSTPWAGIYIGACLNMYFSHMYVTESVLISGYLIDVIRSNNAFVGEADPDGDTTKIDITAVNQDVTATPLSPPSRRTIHGVQSVTVMKANTTEQGFEPIHIIDGITYLDNRRPVGLSYKANESDFREIHPVTGLPLTSTDIAAMSMGGRSKA